MWSMPICYNNQDIWSLVSCIELRSLLDSTDVNKEAEESSLLDAITRKRLVKTLQE
jgi:hypothetical protein